MCPIHGSLVAQRPILSCDDHCRDPLCMHHNAACKHTRSCPPSLHPPHCHCIHLTVIASTSPSLHPPHCHCIHLTSNRSTDAPAAHNERRSHRKAQHRRTKIHESLPEIPPKRKIPKLVRSNRGDLKMFEGDEVPDSSQYLCLPVGFTVASEHCEVLSLSPCC